MRIDPNHLIQPTTWETLAEDQPENYSFAAWYIKQEDWTVCGINAWPNKAAMKEGRALIDSPYLLFPSICVVNGADAWTLTITQLSEILQKALDCPDTCMEDLLIQGAREYFLKFPDQAHAKIAGWENPIRFPGMRNGERIKPQVPGLQEKEHFQATVNALHTALGKDDVALALHAGSKSSALIQWLNQGNPERRRQAFHVFPGIFAWMVDYHQNTARASKTLGPAVDKGRSMYEIISELLHPHSNEENLPPDFRLTLERGLRRLVKLPDEQKPTMSTLWSITSGHFCRTFTYKNSRSESLRLFLWNIGTIEMIDMPQNQLQFEHMAGTMEIIFSSVYSNKLSYNWSKAKSYRNYFNAALQPLNKTSDNWLLSQEFLTHWKNNQGEAVRWITASLVESGQTEQGKQIVTIDALFFEHLTMKQWLNISEALHRFHAECTTRHAKAKEEQIQQMEEGHITSLWSAGGPREAEMHGVFIKALTHPLSLLKEGVEMEHCVAGYYIKCFYGQSRIYALQDMDTQERATLEIVQRPSGTNALEVVEAQLRAPGNQTASDTLKRAAQALIQTMNRHPQKAWEAEPIPDEWHDRTEEDPVFKTQVKQWLQSKHKVLLSQAIDKLNPQPTSPTTTPVRRRPRP